jgi:hypothetical protein
MFVPPAQAAARQLARFRKPQLWNWHWHGQAPQICPREGPFGRREEAGEREDSSTQCGWTDGAFVCGSLGVTGRSFSRDPGCGGSRDRRARVRPSARVIGCWRSAAQKRTLLHPHVSAGRCLTQRTRSGSSSLWRLERPLNAAAAKQATECRGRGQAAARWRRPQPGGAGACQAHEPREEGCTRTQPSASPIDTREGRERSRSAQCAGRHQPGSRVPDLPAVSGAAQEDLGVP